MRKRLWICLLLTLCGGVAVRAQQPLPSGETAPSAPDTVVRTVRDTVWLMTVDSAKIYSLQERIKLLEEKERYYREICNKSGVDQEKIERQRDRYSHLVDSLRAQTRLCELENVRKEEANKYLEQRARDAESRVAEATNRKKKVRAIQGIAMRFYRTPNWELRLLPNESGSYDKVLRNRNAGNIEFDFVTGASVMLWDLTKYFNQDHNSKQIGETKLKTPGVRKFDQDFAYDLGIYVGFGGSNLFKNFYLGPSFRFVDFFYFTVGLNVAEYTVLVSDYHDGDKIGPSQTIDDVTAKAWLLKPFLALSIDLDFLSYIKK